MIIISNIYEDLKILSNALAFLRDNEHLHQPLFDLIMLITLISTISITLTILIKTLTPYKHHEAFFWIAKKVFGPYKNKNNLIEFIPRKSRLNKVSPKYKIAFVGDIMNMNKYLLEFDDSIKNFFRDVDLIVGNFEGIITSRQKTMMQLRHDIEILKQLTKGLGVPAKKWALCVSNNHSGDFGYEEYNKSINTLIKKGFNVFGSDGIPNFLYGKKRCNVKINIVSGSQWQNRNKNINQTLFDERDNYFIESEDVFNIFYPHWSYEIELYPRKVLVQDGLSLLDKWDLIFGTHSHTPQPITRVNANGINKVLAYSGGNFTSGMRMAQHNYGIIMKCDLGQLINDNSTFAVGDLEWQFTKVECTRFTKMGEKSFKAEKSENTEQRPTMLVKLIEQCEFFPEVCA